MNKNFTALSFLWHNLKPFKFYVALHLFVVLYNAIDLSLWSYISKILIDRLVTQPQELIAVSWPIAALLVLFTVLPGFIWHLSEYSFLNVILSLIIGFVTLFFVHPIFGISLIIWAIIFTLMAIYASRRNFETNRVRALQDEYLEEVGTVNQAPQIINQLIEIRDVARAFLKNSPILILDEATNQLDSITENLIQDALQNLMQDKTTIVIAHRLSTLKAMDRILVFDQGKIVEDVSNQDLLALNGFYKKLWNSQIGGFLNENFS